MDAFILRFVGFEGFFVVAQANEAESPPRRIACCGLPLIPSAPLWSLNIINHNY
jgi:hypothetical protein